MPRTGLNLALLLCVGCIDLSAAAIDPVEVRAAPGHWVGGKVVGLVQGASLALENNGTELVTVIGDTFRFATRLPEGAPYSVTILRNPKAPPQSCYVRGGAGRVADGAVDSVEVRCVEVDPN